jgi:hypothetical protein
MGTACVFGYEAVQLLWQRQVRLHHGHKTEGTFRASTVPAVATLLAIISAAKNGEEKGLEDFVRVDAATLSGGVHFGVANEAAAKRLGVKQKTDLYVIFAGAAVTCEGILEQAAQGSQHFYIGASCTGVQDDANNPPKAILQVGVRSAFDVSRDGLVVTLLHLFLSARSTVPSSGRPQIRVLWQRGARVLPRCCFFAR